MCVRTRIRAGVFRGDVNTLEGIESFGIVVSGMEREYKS